MASSICRATSDRSFGPRVDPSCRAFDFTLFFEDIFCAGFPPVVLLVLLPFRITVLTKSPVLCSVRSKLLFGKLGALSAIFVTQVVFLALRSQNTTVQTNASLATDILAIAGIAGVGWLSYMGHQRSLRPSTLISLYLSALVILSLPRIRTLWLIRSTKGAAAAMTVTLVLTAVALLLESIEKKSSVVEEKRFGAPEEYSGFWTRTAFVWLAATFRAGYTKVLVPDDLPILDTRLQSDVLRQNLMSTWAKYDHRIPHSLLKACFHTNLFSFLSAIPPRLCRSVFYFTQPLLINATISYVGNASADSNFGIALIGAWVLVFCGIACSTALSTYQVTRFVTRVKGGLIGLIYQESIKARTVDLGETTAIALMGTDVERIGFNFMQIHEAWASVIEIGVAIWLLEQQVFLACLAPVIVIIVSIGINVPVSNAAKKAQVAWIEKVQERLRVTSSIIDDMKAVKMLGLSTLMSDLIQNLRLVEIQTSEAYRKLLVWNVLLSECPQNISPLATFAVNVVIALYWKNGSLLTAQAFTSIALINLLTNPVIQLIQLMPQLLQCVGSFERIQGYCHHANSVIEWNQPSRTSNHAGPYISLQPLARVVPAGCENDRKHVIILENNSFTWEKSKPPFLKDIDLIIPNGSTTVVVGAVSSGKSMLLESILGETICSLGQTLNYTTSIAYCAQQPWLENGTIQSNIIGVLQYDSKWYNVVTSACGLGADLRAFERGDQTVVGSKGFSISGGQKQRISIARAVYSRKDIFILDDVFSGMDAHTVEFISQQLLTNDGLLRKRGATVILATHNHKLMSFADTIVTLENGRIAQTGSPQALLACEGCISKPGLDLRHQDAANKNVEDTEISREESTVAEPVALAQHPIDETISAPDTSRQNGDWSIYNYYFSSSGYTIFIIFLVSMAAWIFCTEFPTIWLKWWSEANETDSNKDLGMYMGLYTFFSLFGVLAIAISCWIGIVNMISKSAISLHSDLLISTLRAPLRFFTTTDTGSLTNRFSQDMELIDMSLPLIMINYISTSFSAIAKAIILIVFSQYLATMVPFVVALLYFLQSFYLRTSRQVRLLEIEAKAPLYTHFIESVAGATTIRAFGWQSQYQERNSKLIDQSQRPAYLQHCIQSWLGFVLDTLTTVIAAVLVAVVVTWREKFSTGNVGVSLVMVMTFSSVLMRMIKTWTMMESSIGAVARVKRFVANTESEEKGNFQSEVPLDWPKQGKVQFESLVAAHSPGAEPVIKGVSFTIRPSEHVAFCGRSGCGKTSTILALLQMIETREGHITVDGIDVSTVPYTDVRSRFNVVPQDPLLMPGTIRFNIDPFGKALDKEIIQALERVRLWKVISEYGGLGKEMDTTTWSTGQKQLLCLARAMIRNSKLLILDEAASSVDNDTEAIMQDIIDTTFKDCTVLAVMHRLTNITQYDKVALLDDGHLMEFDTPQTLLSQDSRFARLYQSSGTP
ncbi:multidrug resistance-associated protein [Pyrenochaeta sp. MPI-SDFR-AT-0127]|nr:multidrug resistance-associated protein [Pyrenochaeta sp. MPI-SDFR-AT-0127]